MRVSNDPNIFWLEKNENPLKNHFSIFKFEN